jgi:CheY-like chemotaxis protein
MPPVTLRQPANLADYKGTGQFLGLVTLVGLIIVAFQTEISRPTAFLVCFASTAAGAALGFLFGIPRVLQGDTAPGSIGAREDQVNRPEAEGLRGSYRLQVNTNLEQISDWLTKILVGVGLIQLQDLPSTLMRIANTVQPAPQATNAPAVVVAIILSFVLLGFFIGYLMTRLYLAGAFGRADAPLVVGDVEVSVAQVSAQVRDMIVDLQEQVLTLKAPAGAVAPEETLRERSKEGKGLTVRSILWVDDNPANNSVMIETLKKLGLSVSTVTSTAEALTRLGSHQFDRIISDLGRKEGLGMNSTAGIDLIKEIRKNDPHTPIVIYCSAEAAAKYRDEALAAGATAVTPSQTQLLRALRLDQ